MVNEPHGHLCNTGGKFVVLNPGELVNVHPHNFPDIQKALPAFVQFSQDLQFQFAQFPVTDNQEISTPASGVEEMERGNFAVQLIQAGAVAFGFFKFGV